MTRHHALRAVSITALVLLLAAGFVRATTLLQLTFNELVSALVRTEIMTTPLLSGLVAVVCRESFVDCFACSLRLRSSANR